MLERHPRPKFVIDHHRADHIARQFPTDRRRRNVALRQIPEQLNIDEEPVRHDDQRLDVPLQQHLEISLKAIPLVMRIRKNRNVRLLIEAILNPTHDHRAKRIGDVEKHHADAVRALAAQKSRHGVRAIAELPRHFFNSFFCCGGDIARKRRIVEDDRNRRGRKAALRRDVAHRYSRVFPAGALHIRTLLCGTHHPARLSQFATPPAYEALFGRHFKRQRLAKPFGFPDAKRNARDHPDTSDDHGQSTQADPQAPGR